MRTPGSTYRLQLNRGFPFSEAAGLVPYLRSLGVETLYCSPVLRAKSGSVHCYDVTDHSEVNPELGGLGMLESLASALRRSGMGLLLDIVPNHMSTSSENRYWMDVLERGRASPYSGMFDVDWDPPDRSLRGKVLLPLLAVPLRRAMASGAVALLQRGEEGASLRAGGEVLPLAPGTLGGLSARRPGVSAEDLAELLSRQHYVPAKWTEADVRINYRRFLNVNELVALRVEDPAVFERTHRAVSSLLASGTAMGVRVDHPDGLRDPARYFRRLKAATGGSYVLAEKILMAGEKLPREWDVDGTTGYNFLNELNGVMVKAGNRGAMDGVYRRFTGTGEEYSADVREGRVLLMKTMRGESRRLARLVAASYSPKATLGAIEGAVKAVASNFEGYRTYVSPRTRTVRGTARARILRAVAASGRQGAHRAALRAVRDALLLEGREGMSPGRRERSLEFVLRFQQFTAAVAVKGEEDTALYRYVRLASLNEVGGDPSLFGGRLADFHRSCRQRAREWPGSMSATSTHDTKRSEDVRARINVISEIPRRWEGSLERWHRLTAPHRGRVRGAPAPTPRDEYLFYQTVLGAWPQGQPGPEFVRRMSDYMLKAVREERAETGWAAPDAAYEGRVARFVHGALRKGSPFLKDFVRFERDVDWFGGLNSLAQTLVKIGAPGVPDIYQGNEVLDYSLVDPDNRRPVDFASRRRMLAKLDSALSAGGRAGAARMAAEGVRTGLAKLYVTATALRFRRGSPDIFRKGDHVPVRALGERKGNIIAFVRKGGRGECVVCAPRFFTELSEPGELPCGEKSWGGTRIVLPRRGPRRYVDVLTGREHSPLRARGARSLMASDVFAEFPVALLKGL